MVMKVRMAVNHRYRMLNKCIDKFKKKKDLLNGKMPITVKNEGGMTMFKMFLTKRGARPPKRSEVLCQAIQIMLAQARNLVQVEKIFLNMTEARILNFLTKDHFSRNRITKCPLIYKIGIK